MNKIFQSHRAQAHIISLIIFLFFASLGSWLAFFNIYLKAAGFAGRQIGLINGAFQMMLSVVVPIWGLFGDKFGRRRIFLISSIVTMILLLGFNYITSFYLFLSYAVLFALFLHPQGPFVDTFAIVHEKKFHVISFGQMRLWGSVGWAAATMIVGQLISVWGVRSIFPIASAVLVMIVAVTYVGYHDGHQRESIHQINLRQFSVLFRNKWMILFFIILLFYGISYAPLASFINLYLNQIGFSNGQIGLAFGILAASEIPFFFFGRKLVRTYGASKIVLATMLVTIFRLLLYSRISSPPVVLMLGALQGVSFSLFWVAAIDLMHAMIPEQWRATGQSLLTAFFFGAGIPLGNICIGFLYDFIPMQQIMVYESVLAAIVLCMMILYFRFQKISASKNVIPANLELSKP